MKSQTSIVVLLKLSFILVSVLTFSTTTSHSKATTVKSLPGYHGHLPFNLETGYVGVGKSEEVQLFYYFIESERDVERDPLILWLTGGPGCSAFSGLVLEIGPLSFNYTAYKNSSELPQFQLNPYSWTKVASIIFLDAPAGTGFSYATTSKAYYADDAILAAYMYEFMIKWLVDHPTFIGSPFYVAGDSYAGKVIPVALQNILDGNENDSSLQINLKGYILGNPLTGINIKNQRVKYAHSMSLVPDEIYESVKNSCRVDYADLDGQSEDCLDALKAANNDMDPVNIAYILESRCVYFSPKPNTKGTEHKCVNEDPADSHRRKIGEEKLCRNYRYLLTQYWANDKGVQEALHVREGTIDSWIRCNQSLWYTQFNESTLSYHQKLTKKIMRALVYSGDQDMAVPYFDSVEWIQQLDIPVDLKWRPWFVDGQVAGYATDYSNNHYRLTYTTIKGGGHTAPEFNPRECFAMIDRWFSLRYL